MSLEDTLANLSIYDAKKYFRKAQNAVFNLTEMEGKVREATNNEPWGASSTLMEQIAQGTFNFREREEIIGMIFKRFTEKTGSEWRQIYKALQLLEYLVKHGSEKFIDDVRSSLRIVKMLEDFHYIDSQGRDQGINVRNRAKAMVLLLQDDNQLRVERKKARETANKYKGVVGGGGANAMNPRAGFSKSTSRGISVSADFDSDDDDGDQPPKCLPKLDNVDKYEKFTFKDEEPLQSQPANNDQSNSVNDNNGVSNKMDIGGNNSNEESDDDDDDDDDDFTEFQTAEPVINTTANNNNNNNNNNTLESLNFNAPMTTNATNYNSMVNSLNSGVVPAIQQISQQQNKANDPFSSLFNAAKETKNAIITPNSTSNANDISKLVNTTSTTTTSTTTTNDNLLTNNGNNNDSYNDNDNDDLFGDLETAQPSVQKTTISSNNNQQNTVSEEIDLLSF